MRCLCVCELENTFGVLMCVRIEALRWQIHAHIRMTTAAPVEGLCAITQKKKETTLHSSRFNGLCCSENLYHFFSKTMQCIMPMWKPLNGLLSNLETFHESFFVYSMFELIFFHFTEINSCFKRIRPR